jgi:hypothetical protein
MPSRPDLRDLVTSVRNAFADADRETLLDVLTFVVQEYVVDGPPPMLMHQAEKLSDLSNLSFAQLISTLQTRLEAPELSLFAVDGEQVSVRIGGVMQPLVMARGGAATSVATELPRPAAGVHIVETPTLPRPPQARPVAEAAPAPAPRPTQGISLRGRPSGEGAPAASGGGAPAAPPQAQPSSGGGAPAPAGAAPAAAQPAPPEKKDSGDDASARYSLLELD